MRKIPTSPYVYSYNSACYYICYLAAERITKAQKNVSVLAESFQKIVDGHPLDFDINAIFEPCLERWLPCYIEIIIFRGK